MFEVPSLGRSTRLVVMTCSVTFGYFLFTPISFIPSIVCVCVCVLLCVLCCVMCVCVRVCICLYAHVHDHLCLCTCAIFVCVCVYTNLCRLLYDCMFLWETFSTEALAKTHQMFKISLFIRTKHTFCVFGSCFRTLAFILIKKKKKKRAVGERKITVKVPLVHPKSSLGSNLRTQML